jgi:hypothetical protein
MRRCWSSMGRFLVGLAALLGAFAERVYAVVEFSSGRHLTGDLKLLQMVIENALETFLRSGILHRLCEVTPAFSRRGEYIKSNSEGKL